MANELRYIDPVLAATAVTMTATLYSMTNNSASVQVSLTSYAGGFSGDLPGGLASDIYAVHYESSDASVSEYAEIQTSLTSLQTRLEHCIDLAESDESRVEETYRKFKRGTTDPLIPRKIRTVNGNRVDLRE